MLHRELLKLGLTDDIRQMCANYTRLVVQVSGDQVAMQRLRVLPAELHSGVAAMALACQIVSEAGATVRVGRSDDSFRLLEAGGVDVSYLKELRQPVPRKGYWAIYRAEIPDCPETVATMDYTSDGRLPGNEVYQSPPQDLLAYVAVWKTIYDSDQHSRPLADWQQLYE
jgi:hypothetical protein